MKIYELCILLFLVYVQGDYVDLKPFLNNKGASGPGSNFDGLGTYLQCLSQGDLFNVGNIEFKLSYTETNDNILCGGQTITFPHKKYGGIYLLGTVNHGPITTEITLVYQDGTQYTTTLNLPDWQVDYPQQIHRLDHTSCALSNGNNGTLFLVPLLVDPSKELSHMLLPVNPGVGSFQPALHLFGITTAVPDTIKVLAAKGTQRWWEHSKTKEYPIVTVRLQNTSPQWVQNISVYLNGPLYQTQYPGYVKRLAPGHIANVDVAIHTIRKDRFNSLVDVNIYTGNNNLTAYTRLNNIELGIITYEATEKSLHEHSVPQWFELAKFGIFIHWGVYSVPSWAPVGQNYAEWYWWNYNQKYSDSYYYHKSFYGPDIEYDDFIPIWNPDQFNPADWLDLVDASGAKYFVFTSKHHDGIALFDTKLSNRSSVQMNPHRNFVKELMDEAKKSFPHLKKGIYFSLPEWFHPSYHDQSLHWDGPPKNPYTGKTVPYTGAPEISDFVNELQVPQIYELMDHFQPDIMWCDIGGINNSTVWQSIFLNSARQQGRQVTINDRCGNSVSDFSTVEYRSLNYVPNKFWEATRGIDPYSFGYNHATRPDQYTSTTDLVQELVSTLAKGGNFLLNIGPESSGRIPDVMKQTLLQIGRWIDRVEESLFETVPYWVTSYDFHEPNQPLYFAQSVDGQKFYIFSVNKPVGGKLVVKTKVPVHPQSRLSLLVDKIEYLKWRVASNDRLIVEVPDHVVDQEDILWVFKVEAP